MKKFFEKKKLDYKFAKAGSGHTLGETPPQQQGPAQPSPPRERHVPTQAGQLAGTAALARLDSQPSGGACKPKLKNTTMYKEMEAEAKQIEEVKQKLRQQHSQEQQEVTLVTSHNLSVNLICPLCHHVLPYHEMNQHLTVCLQQEYHKEPLSGSVNMIHTLCRDLDKKGACIDIICKYLNNLIENSTEEKYRKIRMSNKTFQEKVASVNGAILFLEAVGFAQQSLPHQDGEEQFLVIPEATAKDTQTLETCKELLETSQALVPSLDRNAKLFKPSSKATHFDLPNDFYKLKVEEIKKEMKARSEAVEKELQLRTKKMRERDEMKMTVRHYRFVLLRIKFLDGIILQGVFKPLETIFDIRQFVTSSLEREECPFSLSAYSKSLDDESMSIAQSGLAPASVINLAWSTPDLVPKPPYFKMDLLQTLAELT
ncbi:UBX domain-containing protein 6-like [Dysidea avara]|uniref:UBX domain-containing protein 6-like n=1 Tax=Dysidea avara TaxID=196820 RepID=UPI0033214CFD